MNGRTGSLILSVRDEPAHYCITFTRMEAVWRLFNIRNIRIQYKISKALAIRVPGIFLAIVDRECMIAFQHIWLTARTKDLFLATPPLGVINSIDPVLDFHDHTSILWHNSRLTCVVEKALRLFEGKRACRFLVQTLRIRTRLKFDLPF